MRGRPVRQDCGGKLRQITDEPCSKFPEDSLFWSWLIVYTGDPWRVANTVISMTARYAEAEPAERVVARFLREYHGIWQGCFPGLIRRTHWHVIFAARSSFPEGVPCRSIHRTLYGLYGTDIRTCIERIKDCEKDGLIGVTDATGQPCSA